MTEPAPSPGLYTRFASGLLFPLQEWVKKHQSVARRRELERTQWLKPDEIAALQLARLREFLVRAAREVPYYGRLFGEHGFDPASLVTLADLARLPFLDKPRIRAHVEDLKSRSTGPLVKYNTGGSTGEPLVFYMGMGRVVAAKWRATRWWGVDIGDPEVVLWGSPVELGRQDRYRAIRDRLFRTYLLPAFQMSEAQMDDYCREIRRISPRMVFGYASAVALLARHARSRGHRLDDLGVRVVFTTGETLYPDQREVIEAVFGAPVANGYGSRDAGFIAHQCPSGSLHVSAEDIVVELVDAEGGPVAPGESGEIVVTHMATDDFPFIRYRTGDVAVASGARCPCGRGLPVLDEVQGRSTDFIRTVSGNQMHALALIYEVRDKPGVRAFKFIQGEDLSLELLLDGGPELTAEVEGQIRAGLTRRMGPGTVLQIRRVTEIPPEKSGKYRYVVSRAAG
ncbi:MAG: AMP-binding protein [Anaerolineae bacterium]|nr:AMP-binding protein [Anaerolineae bacterium]